MHKSIFNTNVGVDVRAISSILLSLLRFEEEEEVMPTVAVMMNGFSCSPSSVREGGEFIFALIFSPCFEAFRLGKKLRFLRRDAKSVDCFERASISLSIYI